MLAGLKRTADDLNALIEKKAARSAMRSKYLALMSALLLLLVIAVFLLFPRDRPASLAHSAFRQIEPGMTRKEVWNLMQDFPDAVNWHANAMACSQFGGRFLVIVKFDPDYYVEPGTVDERDPEGENWRATEVTLHDFSERGPIEKLVMHVGLWSGNQHLTKP
jgi:hypothetical protein